MSFGLIAVGYMARFSIPMSLFVFIAGGLMMGLFIMTDEIKTGSFITETGASALYHYNIEQTSGGFSISGLTNPIIRGEYVFSTSSMLYGDIIDCIDVLVRKQATPTLDFQVGVFDHAQTDSDPLILSFGTMDSELLNTFFEWKTFCLPVGQTYTIGDQDVFGIKYTEASATNVVQIGGVSADVFDGSNTEHTSQSSATFVWSNFGTTDTNLRLYLRSDAGILQTDSVEPFTEELKVFMVLMASVLLLFGGAIEIQSRRS
jgi:hypothetical protein